MKGKWKALVVVAVFVTVTLVSGECANGANGCIEIFNQTFDLTYASQLHAVQQTTDGGYIFAGSWRELLAGTNTDVLLLKTDSGGNEQWNKTWGDTYGQFAYAVQQTTDGGYILAGYTRSSGTHDVLLLKTDANGTELWNTTFGGSGNDDAYAVQQTTDGGYILAGSTYVENETVAWWIKTDANGTEQWNKTPPINFRCTVAYDVQQTTDGGYIIAGCEEDYLGAPSLAGARLIKTYADGTVEKWNYYDLAACGSMFRYGAYAVDQTADGGYILAGYRRWCKTNNSCLDPADYTEDLWLAKIEPQELEVEWKRAYWLVHSIGWYCWVPAESNNWGGSSERAYDVQQTADGGYIVVGYTESYGAGGKDAYVIKTYSDGSMQWSMTFGSTREDTAYAVQQTADGGYILAGHYNYRLELPLNTGDGWLWKLKEEVLWGDVNGDGAINMGDVGLLHNHVHYGYPRIG